MSMRHKQTKTDMKTEAARAAQAIRKELKANFPNTKFRVTSKSYSMGDNVNVSYVDGPRAEEVESLLAKYEYGTFDGMTDMYNADNMRDDLPQTKYLFVEREQGEEIREFLQKWARDFYDFSRMSEWEQDREYKQYAWREFKNLSYPELMFV